MKIGIAADHGGFALKETLRSYLTKLGHELIDFGNFRQDAADDYPDFVVPLARAIVAGEVERGIAVCGSGVGASIVANKVAGIRAALINDSFSAHQGVEDDDLNLMCLGGRVIGFVMAQQYVRAFLKARFSGADRHVRRLNKVKQIETNQTPFVMVTSNVRQIHDFGQSIWLDFIDRKIMNSGELQRLIDEDGVRGITSNPAIFEKAISSSADYDADISELSQTSRSNEELFYALAVKDIQRAADLFRPVYDEAPQGSDGYVSLEVSPLLARHTDRTVAQARHLWEAVDRDNVMIKIPGTAEGLPAIEQCIAQGLNINVTLLFGLDRYEAVADAYIAGLEQRSNAGLSIDHIASVASFFLSRIDTLIDPILTEKGLDALKGEVAIASAKKAYESYQRLFSSDRFQKLADKGAQPQRLLWASTGSKDPAFSDVKYLEALIGPHTVNTVPMDTLVAFRDHGVAADRLAKNLDKATETLRQLADADIDLAALTGLLEDEGIEKFNAPYQKLLNAIETQRTKTPA